MTKNKGMNEAKMALRYENMLPEDQAAYKRHIENQRIEMGVMETAIDKAQRKKAIEVAKVLLAARTNKELIVAATELTMQEILKMEQGEDIDKEDDEDDYQFIRHFDIP